MCTEQFQKWTLDLLFCSIFLPFSSQGFVEDKKLDLEGYFLTCAEGYLSH